MLRAVVWGLLGVVLIAVLLPASVLIFGLPGIGDDRLRSEAESALTRLVGSDVSASFSDPHIFVDGTRFLGVQIDKVRLDDAGKGETILEAGTLRFGLRAMPLLAGEVRLANAFVEDAVVNLAALPKPGGDWLEKIKNPAGLVAPRLVLEEAFAGLHRAINSLEQASTRKLDLSNVRIEFPSSDGVKALVVSEGAVRRALDGNISYSVTAAFDGNAFVAEGEIKPDQRTGLIAGFASTVAFEDVAFTTKIANPKPHVITGMKGKATARIEASEVETGPGSMSLTLTVDDGEVTFGDGSITKASATLSSFVDAEKRKVEIDKLELLFGRSRILAHGAIGPSPPEPGDAPHYRFELVSDGSRIAPEGSMEPDLMAAARIGGSVNREFTRIFAGDIGVRTREGEAVGSATFELERGKSPGINLSIAVPSMPVSHVKQLWPWFGAAPAKNWANANLFSGVVRDSRLEMDVRPGRIGDGVPLRREEIAGHFEVYGTRFDIAGEIPPVRDGEGIVDFRGTDVDIALKAGTIYLATGRTVEMEGGSFLIRRGEQPPVIGALDVNIRGAADAVTELAGYKPIDALRHLPVAPDDLTGTMSGNVKANIPLQKGANFTQQEWGVKLAYEGLTISKPIQGQLVSNAKGTIDVDPRAAVIKADANLNGIPAQVMLTEPLGSDKSGRLRDVSLKLDDKTRDAIAPGLSMLISGPIALQASGTGSPQRITADLKSARLSVPWVGWSKGAGVPATLSFLMETEGGETRISDMKLTGDTFSVLGSATVTKSGLVRASLNRVRLNRNDDISVDIRRSDGGYAVSVKGDTLDARALVKQVLSEGGGTGNGKSGGAKAVPIALDASVGYVSGFGGEALSNVKISYRGAGSRIGSLDLSASARSGGRLVVKDGTSKGRRSLSMASSDAGAVLRFLDLYPHMRGGQIELALSGNAGEALSGQIDARNFVLVDEPRLRSMVATRANGGQSLNDAVKQEIDTSSVQFERGYAQIEKGTGYLNIKNGALRGPVLGTTFQGALYDKNGNISITGTFMPAYGLNSLFAEIPLVGLILGNGRDRGLIGITYKVSGDAKKPNVIVNPISAIAPGIFRSIFEFN